MPRSTPACAADDARYRPFADFRLWRVGLPSLGVFVFAAVFAIAVLTNRGQALENRALRAAEFGRGVPELLRLVSVPGLIVATLTLVGVALLRRRADAAIRALAVLAVSNVAVQVLKYGLLSRPSFSDDLSAANTFPSGHTTAWLSVSCAALIVVPPLIRAIVAVIGATFSSLVVFDLLDHGWHRLSDIVGAVALVVVVTSLAVTLIRVPTSFRRGRQNRLLWHGGQKTLDRWVSSVLLIVAAAGVAGAAVCVLGATLARHSADQLLLYATEALAVGCVCFAIAAVLAFLGKTVAGSPPALGRGAGEATGVPRGEA